MQLIKSTDTLKDIGQTLLTCSSSLAVACRVQIFPFQRLQSYSKPASERWPYCSKSHRNETLKYSH